MQQQIDHANYPKGLRNRSVSELRFIISDCRSAIAAYPNSDKSGYYADEIHYAAEELMRRKVGMQSASEA